MATSLDPALVAAFRAGTLTTAQAEAMLPSDRSAIVFLLRQLSMAVAAVPTSGPHTPPSVTPPFAKPTTPARQKPKGSQPGDPGRARPKPTRIDRREEHTLTNCPKCGGPVQPTVVTRTRIIEDIPDDLKTETVEHTIHRSWCPCCRQQVEPTVPDALPNCTLGHRTTVFAAWLYYGLAVTISQIVAVFQHHLQTTLTADGLLQMWHPFCERPVGMAGRLRCDGFGGESGRSGANRSGKEFGERRRKKPVVGSNALWQYVRLPVVSCTRRWWSITRDSRCRYSRRRYRF